jgi:hypothetical protein
MFPKPPRPEPPRRAVATVVVRQQAPRQPVATVLVAGKPAVPASAPVADTAAD